MDQMSLKICSLHFELFPFQSLRKSLTPSLFELDNSSFHNHPTPNEAIKLSTYNMCCGALSKYLPLPRQAGQYITLSCKSSSLFCYVSLE